MKTTGPTELTVAQVARYAMVPVRTVRHHLATGRLKGRKVGRDWIVRAADANRYAEEYQPYDSLRRPGVFR